MDQEPHMPPRDSTYAPRGQHLLLTFSGCAAPILDDRAALETLARRAAEATGATVLGVQGHHFDPRGVTVLALLAESHLGLHSYPETGVVFVDCFTCGACDPRRSIPILAGALRPFGIREELIDREG